MVGTLKVVISSYIYPKELQQAKENNDKHKASFLDLDIKITDGKFHFGLFEKKDWFPFSIVRLPGKSSNVPSNIVYSAIGGESLRIDKASNNRESFSTTIQSPIARLKRQQVTIGKISSFILNFLDKH